MEVATSRFGNGPQDYYIVNSGQQIIIAVPRDKQSEGNEEESDEDESNYRAFSNQRWIKMQIEMQPYLGCF